ncbi:MAG: lysophospholipid acyltransferase family protein [Anaerovoracaceae bacterium]|jgi:1-acyl-sn-glycerol-3-phosphate acyltransferase
MRIKHEPKIEYFHDYDEDFVSSGNQDKKLPEGYVWVHRNPLYRAASWLLYAVAILCALVYVRLVLRVRFKNRRVLKAARRTGCFLYGNHTQPVGDVLTPALLAFPKRIYTVAGTANLGIPVIGKLLPMLGALPVPDSLGKMRAFQDAVKQRAGEKRCIIIYPEAHVWPWCSFVRPFSEASFRFPVLCGVPAYCMTTTYQDRGSGKKPRITVFIDGPFYPQQGKRPKEEARRLHDEISECMKDRSKSSDCSYIRYERKVDEP